MPRRARLKLAGITQHIIQRGNNRAVCFFADDDYRYYLQSLYEGAQRYGCAIHAFVLMTNHVHLLVTPQSEEALPCMMRYLGSRYVQYINYVYRRTGTLWEGRYKSNLIDSERYLLACYRYIELNPVRAAITEGPADYPWSSYGAHALGKKDGIVHDHPLYLALGPTGEVRQAAYRDLFRYQIDDETLKAIRESVNGGIALGRERFKDEIEAALGRRVRPGERGRPRKREEIKTPAAHGTSLIEN